MMANNNETVPSTSKNIPYSNFDDDTKSANEQTHQEQTKTQVQRQHLVQLNQKIDESNEEKYVHSLEVLRIVNKIIKLNPEFSSQLLNHEKTQQILYKLAFSRLSLSEMIIVLIIRLGFFVYLVGLFISFMVKCHNYLYNDDKGCIDTKYPKIPNNETKYLIGIPYCSVLYERESQFENLTYLGRFNSSFKWFYFSFELSIILINMISLKIRKIIVIYKHCVSKLEICIEIGILIAKLIIPFIVLIPLFIFISYIFQIFVSYITSENILNFDPFKNLKKADEFYGDTLIIQILLFYCIFALFSHLKLLMLYGRCFIKHSSSIKNLITISVIFSVLEKLYSSTNNFVAESNLLINLYNCSIKNQTVSCSNTSIRIKLSDLRLIGNITKDYSAELNSYIYDNSIIEKVIMYVAYGFLLFLFFILASTIYDKFDCYKSNLQLAKLEQNLRLIQHTQKNLSNIYYSLKENDTFKDLYYLYRNGKIERNKMKIFKALANYLWMPFYFIIKKSDIDMVLIHYKETERFDQNELYNTIQTLDNCHLNRGQNPNPSINDSNS